MIWFFHLLIVQRIFWFHSIVCVTKYTYCLLTIICCLSWWNYLFGKDINIWFSIFRNRICGWKIICFYWLNSFLISNKCLSHWSLRKNLVDRGWISNRFIQWDLLLFREILTFIRFISFYFNILFNSIWDWLNLLLYFNSISSLYPIFGI